MRSLSIAATGMQAQQMNVEVISNNIANMNTTAYTERKAAFQDLLYQDIRRPGSTSSEQGNVVPAGIQLGLGVRTAAVYRIATPGSVASTDNPLDVSVQGKGYFQILLPDGTTAYTRDGSFQESSSGQLVTHDGYQVLPGITIPSTATAVTINASGQVLATISGQQLPQTVGQLTLASFSNEAGLAAYGQNLYTATQASGTAITSNPNIGGFGSILQGYLESSNVNVVSEITNLISAQRAYEMNSKVIQTSDQMMQSINQVK